MNQVPAEVIPETPLNRDIKIRNNIYNDIMASIGLDSPTSSQDTRGDDRGKGSKKDTTPHTVNTPVCNNAASLMALGKHVLIPREGRLWEYRSKSPLGG